MGRAKYSPEKRKEVVTSFVRATIEIIKDEGVESVTIRRVSSRAGYSSATLYLYFEDLNELISVASVFYLRNYVHDIAETGNEDRTAEETYRYTWDVFCRHALNKPTIYLNLFFGPNSDSLDDMVQEYYGLFPEELESVHSSLLNMLEAGSLLARNKTVLAPLASELGMSDDDVDLVNNITVAYFRSILERAVSIDMNEERKEAFVQEFLNGAFFILKK